MRRVLVKSQAMDGRSGRPTLRKSVCPRWRSLGAAIMGDRMRIVLALLLVFGATSLAHAAMRSETVAYAVDGKAMQGVLVWDDAVKTPRPGLLMIPDWTGINATNIDFAKQIAGHDYVIFMGDMYGKDLRPKNNKEAQAATRPLYADRPLLRKRVVVAFDELKALAAKHAAPIDASRFAAIGFCFRRHLGARSRACRYRCVRRGEFPRRARHRRSGSGEQHQGARAGNERRRRSRHH